MSDLLEDDLEFRGGTLQLSADHVAAGTADNTANQRTGENSVKSKPQSNANPSVLSGADSLSSSTASFTGKRVIHPLIGLRELSLLIRINAYRKLINFIIQGHITLLY